MKSFLDESVFYLGVAARFRKQQSSGDPDDFIDASCVDLFCDGCRTVLARKRVVVHVSDGCTLFDPEPLSELGPPKRMFCDNCFSVHGRGRRTKREVLSHFQLQKEHRISSCLLDLSNDQTRPVVGSIRITLVSVNQT